jgi:hypothetical protein
VTWGGPLEREGVGVRSATTPTPACQREGFHLIPTLPAGCEGVCFADDAARTLPRLVFDAGDQWCRGCTALETPWATAPEEKARAVDGSVRAVGPGPTWLKLPMFVGKDGIAGIYGQDGTAVAGFNVHIQGEGEEPCGRMASLRFSVRGELGAHLLERVGNDQFFFGRPMAQASRLFAPPPKLTWRADTVVHRQGINDMWFSTTKVAIDLSGTVWLGDLASGATQAAMDVPGAAPGNYYTAFVVDDDVFVARLVGVRTEWWVLSKGSLAPLLQDEARDMRGLASDGTWLVWVQGEQPEPTSDPFLPIVYRRHSLMRARYTVDAAKLAPELLLADVPPDFSYLAVANDRVVGIYLLDTTVYRAGAIVVPLDGGHALNANLISGSWGYELFPAADTLWGPVTTGPMIYFETFVRYPYSEMTPWL